MRETPDDRPLPPVGAGARRARRRLLHRGLRSRPARAALTLAGVAASTLLVLVLLAAYRGLGASVASYTGQPGIDLWVGPQGVDNLIRSSAMLLPEQVDDVMGIEGLRAEPLIRGFVPVEGAPDESGKPRAMLLLAIGYRIPDGLGGPPQVAQGRRPSEPQEVALDRAAAYRLGLKVDDEMKIGGQTAKLVGLTRETNLLSTQLLFCDVEALQQAMGLKGRASFVAVRIEDGRDPKAVARQIEEETPGAAAWERQVFSDNSVREITTGIVPLLVLIAALGAAMAAVLVALLVNGLIEERRPEIGVLLAMGAPAVAIGGAVLRHILTLVVIGALSGTALALGLDAALDRWVPTIELASAPYDCVFAVLLFSVAGTLAALAPVAMLSRIDPLEAFRS
ncbi:MAG: ABC transporter permease [Myxococcales bacterium]|jgi:putative ABC transport system permease protein